MKKSNYADDIYMIETEDRLELIQILDEMKIICPGGSGPINPDAPDYEPEYLRIGPF